MSEERPSEILGSLPRTRPHRRSGKRGAVSRAATSGTSSSDTESAPNAAPKRDASAKPRRAARTQTLRQPRQPGGTPPRPRKQTPESPGRRAPLQPPTARRGDVVSTVVHAAAELTEIGLSLSARALRGAVGRLPRP